jgi:hypothetical protein
MRRHKLLAAIALATAVVLVPGAAFGYWTSQGTGSGSASTGTLNPPTNVSVPTTSTGTVAVTWTASAGSTTPTGYYVTRIKNSDSSSANVCSSSPSSLISGTSCNDTGVADGTYHYTVTAVYHSWSATSAGSGNVTVDTSRHLVFTAQPSNTTAGQAISPAVAVTVEDSANNAVHTSGIQITVTIGTNPGSGTLSGTKTVGTNTNGVATFSNLSIDKAGTGYTLGAASSGIAGATSNAFNVSAGIASQLVFTTQPAGAAAGVAFTTQPVVAVEDVYGNVVTTDASAISLTIAPNTPTTGGPGTLSGCSGSSSNGVTTFSNCSIDKSGAGYKLRATRGAITADSAAFTVSPRVTSVLLANKTGNPGGTAGKAEQGDTVTIQFSGQMDASSFCSTWTGGSGSLTANNDVTVKITNSGANDSLTVTSASCSFNFGTVSLGGDYVSGDATFSGTGSNASMVSLTSSGVLTITLGTASPAGNIRTGVTAGTPVYTPANGLKDSSGTSLPTTAVSGTSSRF